MIRIARGRDELGNFTEQEVADGLQSGRFLPSDLAWYEGLASWQELSTIGGLPSGGGAASEPTPPPTSFPAYAPGAPSSAVVAVQPEPAWERRETEGFFGALVESVKQVLLAPSATFEAMPKSGGMGSPLIFCILLGTIGGAVAVIYQLLAAMVNPESMGEMEPGVFYAIMVVVIVLMPLFVLIGIFVNSAVLHICLMLVGGAKQSFETTLRVICYAQGATAVFYLVPICGGIIGGIWSLVALVIGLSKAHEIGIGKAIFAILLPLIVCCGLLFVLFGLALLIPSLASSFAG